MSKAKENPEEIKTLPESLRIAARGLWTSGDAMNCLGKSMQDLFGGRISSDESNALTRLARKRRHQFEEFCRLKDKPADGTQEEQFSVQMASEGISTMKQAKKCLSLLVEDILAGTVSADEAEGVFIAVRQFLGSRR